MKSFLDNFTDTTNLKSRNGQERIQSTLTVKSIKDNILQQYSCTAKNRAASVTKKADIFIKGIFIWFSKFFKNEIQRHQKYWKKISLVTKNFDMQKLAMKLEWYASQKDTQIQKSHGQLPLDSKSSKLNSIEKILGPFVLLWPNFPNLTIDF